MALFSISDLHLSFGTDKPMDVFGKKWENYEEKLKTNWNNTVDKDDVVIVNKNSRPQTVIISYERYKRLKEDGVDI